MFRQDCSKYSKYQHFWITCWCTLCQSGKHRQQQQLVETGVTRTSWPADPSLWRRRRCGPWCPQSRLARIQVGWLDSSWKELGEGTGLLDWERWACLASLWGFGSSSASYLPLGMATSQSAFHTSTPQSSTNLLRSRGPVCWPPLAPCTQQCHKSWRPSPPHLPCTTQNLSLQCDRMNLAKCSPVSGPCIWCQLNGGGWAPEPAPPDRTWRPPRWTSPPWRAGWRGPHLSRSPRSGRACPQSVKLINLQVQVQICQIWYESIQIFCTWNAYCNFTMKGWLTSARIFLSSFVRTRSLTLTRQKVKFLHTSLHHTTFSVAFFRTFIAYNVPVSLP